MSPETPQQLSKPEAETHAQIIQYVYGGLIESGQTNYDAASEIAGQNVEIARTLDNESLLEAHKGVSKLVVEMEDAEDLGVSEVRQDELAEAFSATGTTIMAMPFIDVGRAESMYHEVLDDPEGHEETLPFVLNGMSGLTLLIGDKASSLWDKAQNLPHEYQDSLFEVVKYGTAVRIKEELQQAERNPKSMPKNFHIPPEILNNFE